jgi:hypothetical protein
MTIVQPPPPEEVKCWLLLDLRTKRRPAWLASPRRRASECPAAAWTAIGAPRLALFPFGRRRLSTGKSLSLRPSSLPPSLPGLMTEKDGIRSGSLPPVLPFGFSPRAGRPAALVVALVGCALGWLSGWLSAHPSSRGGGEGPGLALGLLLCRRYYLVSELTCLSSCVSPGHEPWAVARELTKVVACLWRGERPRDIHG